MTSDHKRDAANVQKRHPRRALQFSFYNGNKTGEKKERLPKRKRFPLQARGFWPLNQQRHVTRHVRRVPRSSFNFRSRGLPVLRLDQSSLDCRFSCVCGRFINIESLGTSVITIKDVAFNCTYATRRDTTRHDTTRRDMTRRDMTRHDATRHDTTRYDAIWRDMTRHDTTWYDTTRRNTTRRDTTRRDTTRHDTTRHDTTRRDTTRHDTALHYLMNWFFWKKKTCSAFSLKFFILSYLILIYIFLINILFPL